MELDHQFDVAAPVDEAWPAFLDMPRLAPCMPGAEVSEVIDDRNVKGGARVKVGPLSLRFAGRAEMVEIDEAGRAATMVAKGSDTKGRGNAEAEVRFSLAEAGPATTAVKVNTNLNLTGSVAQYGRATGLIDEIANQLITEFVLNLEQELATATTSDSGNQVEMPASEREHPKDSVSGLALFFNALWSYLKKLFVR